MIPYGCRKVKVFTNVTEAEIDRHGAFGYIEITNLNPIPTPPIPPTPDPDPEDPPVEGASVVDPNEGVIWVTVNHFPEQGHVGTKIPIKPGTTKQLPLVVYKFTATGGTVDVIAYGL